MNSFLSHTASTLYFLLVCYLILFLMFVLLSDLSIFLPPRPTTFTPGENTHRVQVGDKNIMMVYLPNPNSKYTLLLSHGNAEDLGTLMPLLKYYHHKGYAVVGYDYQGYGLSEGRANERRTYQDIEAVYRYMKSNLNIDPKTIIAYGRSLGSGPTMELAINHDLFAVVLEAPFVSAFRVVTHWPLFPYDKFKNNKKVQKVDEPILVIHGKKDSVIPFWHGQKLFDLAQSPKQHYWIEDANHNDILQITADDYWGRLSDFINFAEKQK